MRQGTGLPLTLQAACSKWAVLQYDNANITALLCVLQAPSECNPQPPRRTLRERERQKHLLTLPALHKPTFKSSKKGSTHFIMNPTFINQHLISCWGTCRTHHVIRNAANPYSCSNASRLVGWGICRLRGQGSAIGVNFPICSFEHFTFEPRLQSQGLLMYALRVTCMANIDQAYLLCAF